ncbi:PhnD/SsuA/transferrin family substrate-binding protein [Psychromarinibacter sp. C21-152]|uniref:PhnD/SsuA/transferrin family substrate-binding protein n=1 Tax=Psychromarinibacter sediminicola TaxID=3033385 RepID=A0AAE3NV81_9RHOB|nr:PhnD/SsuA/transferrin family substrate-binding protein [Psychromarinibacter sediminicola]MDF0602901.1 PhnD/SsuA/transferrin family substrate-binding protein [Psychromarinibacter sediminicola]
MDRRRVLGGLGASVALSAPAFARRAAFRFGLTPVFLDNDANVIERLRTALSDAKGDPIDLIQRRTYQEITASLLDGSVDAAWICGYPFLQHRDRLALLGVPVWRGRPQYQSYLIVRAEDQAKALADLRGGIHAFSDPNSNSGYLVTASDLARMDETPERFFSRAIFTYGHRNVVRAVADGLTRSGSVDGYVWEALASVEPSLTAPTRIVAKSEWLGFPPFAARADRASDPNVRRFGKVLRGLGASPIGREALQLLFLDGIQQGDTTLFNGIAARMAELSGR